MRILAIAIAALALGVSGCGQASHETAAQPSGIRGKITVDIGCPTITSTPCPRVPLQARLLIYSHGTHHRVAHGESDKDGFFRISLPPGRYEIQPMNITGAPVPTAHPVNVTVRARTWTSLRILFDSGVR